MKQLLMEKYGQDVFKEAEEMSDYSKQDNNLPVQKMNQLTKM
jgi:hypothetical protein